MADGIVNFLDITSFLSMVSSYANNAEVQAIFLFGCTCIGAWMLFIWLLQVCVLHKKLQQFVNVYHIYPVTKVY